MSTLDGIDIGLERDGFLRQLLHHLSGALQDTVGMEEASGFVSVVGQRIGDELNQNYRQALAVDHLNKEQVRDALLDLKSRIQGDFYVIQEDDEKIVFGNRQCPFAEKVVGRPSLCMMTSNVFGSITAENLGYGKVTLKNTIAAGDSGCHVTVWFRQTDNAEQASGIEYYPSH